MSRGEIELRDTLTFSFSSTSKGSINPGLQQVPEDPAKEKVDLLATGRICPREKVLIINELPTASVCEVCASTDQSPSKGHF